MPNQYLHYVKVFKFDNGALRLYHLLETYRPWKENVPSAFQSQFPQWMADCHYVYTVYDLIFLPNPTIICFRSLIPSADILRIQRLYCSRSLYSMHCGFTSAITNI